MGRIVFRGKLSEGDYDLEYSQNKDYRSLKEVRTEDVIDAIDRQFKKKK